MKKIASLTTAALVFLSLTASAQIKKGSFFLGGDIAVANVKTSRTSTSSSGNTPPGGKIKALSIQPVIGIAVKENLIAGVDVAYSKGKSENVASTGTINQDGFGAGVFLRRYYPLASRFYLFGQARLGYAKQNSEQKLPSTSQFTIKEETASVLASLYPGLAYNVTKSFYLEVGFSNLLQTGYEKTTRTESQTFNNNTVRTVNTEKGFFMQSSLANTTSLNVGVRFIIP